MPYSGTSDSKLPPYIQKLGLKFRKAWVASFNSAYSSYDPQKHKASNAEKYAFAVANSVVRKMKGKKKESVSFFPNGTKFVTAKEVELYDNIVEDYLKSEQEIMKYDDYTIGDSIITSLKEATIDESSRTAEIVALVSGVSKNGNYYSKEVAESLAPFLLQRRKIYLNHVDESAKKLGRNLNDWVATVEESYGKDGKCNAKIRFSENQNGEFIFKEALIHPEEIQFSIDALARAKEGEVEGKKVTVIERFAFLDSLDIVDYASAGGKLVRAYASQAASDLSVIHEATQALKDRVEKYAEKEKLNILLNCFINMLYELSWTSEYESDEDKREAIQTLIDDFLTEFENIDIIKAFEADLNKEVEKMNLSELKENHSDLLEEYKKEVLDSDVVKDKETKISTLEAKVSELNASLEQVNSDLEKTKTDLTAASTIVDQYKSAEQLKEREEKIKTAIKEANLGEFESLPEYTRKDLMSKDTDESLTEAINALVALRASGSGRVVDAGETSGGEPDKTKTNFAKDNDAAAKVFKQPL
jgi:cation transport regulator ChaB/outer membrane murein-binding lipoprotein Lpp